MKVAIYARVSTIEQNLEAQKTDLIRMCEAKGWDYTLYTEQESTRGTRPIKQNLIQNVRRGLYNGVVVWKLDRWARSLRELVTDIDDLGSRGVWFYSHLDNIDLSTPNGRLQFQILGAFAEFERDLISVRTREALRAKKENGVRLGRPPGSKDKTPRKKRGVQRTPLTYKGL